MTTPDTPPHVPYVPGPDATRFGHPSTWSTTTPAGPPRKRTSRLPLIVAIVLGVLVLAGGTALAYTLVSDRNGTGSPAPAPAAADSPTAAATTSAPAPAAPTTAAAATTASAPKTGLPVGSTVHVTMKSGELDVTLKSVTTRKNQCKGDLQTKPLNGVFMVLDVTLKVTSGTAPINPLYFSHVTTSGTATTWVDLTGCTDIKGGNETPAGTVISGRILFDVPSVAGTVVYADPVGNPAGSWKVP